MRFTASSDDPEIHQTAWRRSSIMMLAGDIDGSSRRCGRSQLH
jgi:hypothetical protein